MSLDDQGNTSTFEATSTLSAAAAAEQTPYFTALIYPALTNGDSSSSSATLAALATSLQSFIQEQLHSIDGYIWHREAPVVRVTQAQHLRIGFRTGACVEDEWLLIHLLRLASTAPRFANVDLAISVSDEDGEILLIEAADTLPEWLAPDCARGRAWIYKGGVHLLTPAMNAGKNGSVAAPTALEPVEALPYLRANTGETYDASLTGAAFARIATSYPALTWARETQHRTLAYLPRRAALVLSEEPQLISGAAEALEGREGPSDARVCAAMKRFGPRSAAANAATTSSADAAGDSAMASSSATSTAKEEKEGQDTTILTRVTLSRSLYATLLTQRFFPPKPFGTAWRSAVETYWAVSDAQRSGAPLPVELQALDERALETYSAEGRRRDIGAKIAAGLELLCARAEERGAKRWRDQTVNPRTSTEYAPFLASLQRMGYFGEEMEGSAKWKELESAAVEKWAALKRSQAASGDEEEDEGHFTDDISAQINAILANETTSSSSSLLVLDPNAPRVDLAAHEDPDAFLYDAPPGFTSSPDAAGATGVEEAGLSAEERAAEAQLKAFAERLDSFVDAEGDVEGALFDDELNDPDSEEEEDEAGETAEEARKRVMRMTREERAEAVRMLIPKGEGEEWVPLSKQQQQQQQPEEKEGKDTPMQDVSSSSGSALDAVPLKELSIPPPSEQLSASTLEAARLSMRSAAADLEADAPRYDGASDSEESIDEALLRSVETNEERRERAKWLDMEDELDSEEKAREQLQKEEEEGDEMPEFKEEVEMKGFVEFARKSLGLTESQFERILEERRARGAFVPPREVKVESKESESVKERKGAKVKFAEEEMEVDMPPSRLAQQQQQQTSTLKPVFGPPRPPTGPAALPQQVKSNLKPPQPSKPASSASPSTSTSAQGQGKGITSASEREAARLKAERVTAAAERSAAARSAASSAQKGAALTPNAELNSFEKVMAALDGELAKHRAKTGQAAAASPTSTHGAQTEAGEGMEQGEDFEEFEPRARPARAQPPAPRPRRVDRDGDEEMASDDDSEEELNAQDAELLQKLLGSGAPSSLAGDGEGAELGLADLLRSFKGQGGAPGPVGTLAGRLGTGLPMDADR